MVQVTSLVNMKPGQSGEIVGLQGGRGLMRNLEGMGIMTGCIIRVISMQIMRGPLIIAKGNTQVALGFGMAQKIMVKIK